MVALRPGSYTGTVLNCVKHDGVLVNTVQYAPTTDPIGMHYHENAHICFLLQGFDEERRTGNAYMRKCGDLFFYRAGEAHSSVGSASVRKSLLVEFDDSFFIENDVDEGVLENQIVLHSHVKFQLLKVLREMYLSDSHSALAIESLLLTLVHSSDGSCRAHPPAWIKTVHDLLHDKWNQSITLAELSAATGLHRITLSKYFSKYQGVTLSDYQRKLKIERSLPLVKNTKMSLSEIAHHCGFADQSHFIRVFKDLTGFLPKHFRGL